VLRRLVAKVGTSNHDRTISLKAAVRSCINNNNNNNNNNKVMIKNTKIFTLKVNVKQSLQWLEQVLRFPGG